MQGFAKLNRCHLWVNAHPGKHVGQKKANEITLYDILGSSHWNNLTDNGLVIWRKSDVNSEVGLRVVKNRWTGWRGEVKLWWREGEGRYNGFEDEYSYDEHH
jgi:hypothetical protein